jgi:hypothetical protein
METYWRKYSKNNSLNEFVPHQQYYIDCGDKVICIEPNSVGTVSADLHRLISRRDSLLLKEVPKEEVIGALKSTINRLDLPVDIKILKHKL